MPFSWKILLSGFTPAYLHEQRKFDTNISFEELQRLSHINEVALQGDQAADFSGRIRVRLLPL
ncbi:MAG: hypothetical protein H0X47_01220 [Nitrospirales bacterium]|nr:hypothetical protein [Nitrospirales bacterium]